MQPISPQSFYADHSNLIDTISAMLLERLDSLSLNPTSIFLCSPCATELHYSIGERYPQATLTTLALDQLTENMTPANQFDLIISHLAWCWLDETQAAVAETRRTIKTQGTVLMTTFGLDANQDLQTDQLKTLDMHDLGDLLLAAGFVDPVMDVEHLDTEVIFGYARGSKQASYQTQNGEIAIPISSIRRLN